MSAPGPLSSPGGPYLPKTVAIADEIDAVALNDAVSRAVTALRALQSPDGYWCFELEADCTIPAEYILMMHYMDEINPVLQEKLAVYLREHQGAGDGWALYPGGSFDISCSVKAYYALKLAGDDPEAPHMARARAAILAYGGAARANVFTRIALAQFGQVPWRAIPFMPVELMLAPRWFPIHLSRVSYWSRTVMVPLLILCSRKVRARNPTGIHIRELFTTPPERERHYFPVRSTMNRLFLMCERVARRCEGMIPPKLRARAIREAERWFIERLNGAAGALGAIFPAMVNAYEALDHLGYPADHRYRVLARQALEALLVVGTHSAYCQPCVSPIWDTGLACLALQEAGPEAAQNAVPAALSWMMARQLLDAPGDWREYRPGLPGGGWPFQFDNGHYPDLDDTSVVAWSMIQANDTRYRESVHRAAEWVCGMQSRNGGFAAFDADNTHYYLNEIPFSDHGALLDPPTSDVTARCISLLSQQVSEDTPHYRDALERALHYLRCQQETDGSWFGRWGTNYIYGTWSALVAFAHAGVPIDDPAIRRAASWLKRMQRADGGWSESNDSYHDQARAGRGERSTSYQTAWALLGLMAAGEVASEAVRRGVGYLLRTQSPADGLWNDPEFTAPGFPKVFYLKYHGYDKYFPLWALARYRTLKLSR
ncbi:MAG: squalene--hopene cyclase [Acidiferrobacteraceae bacterium]